MDYNEKINIVSNAELKPCPFCGFAANLEKINTKKKFLKKTLVGYVVVCKKCKAQGAVSLNPIDSFKSWNARAID